jgi:alpha-tubulin suppressor-like RCC1 family protein
VANLVGVTSVTTGDSHACATLEGGSLACWGGNNFGELGNGLPTDPAVCAAWAAYDDTCTLAPVDVPSISGLITVSAGTFFTCAVLPGGSVKCWGLGSSGQLGNGTTADSSVPVTVSGF